jgi:hypothetical protein
MWDPSSLNVLKNSIVPMVDKGMQSQAGREKTTSLVGLRLAKMNQRVSALLMLKMYLS